MTNNPIPQQPQPDYWAFSPDHQATFNKYYYENTNFPIIENKPKYY